MQYCRGSLGAPCCHHPCHPPTTTVPNRLARTLDEGVFYRLLRGILACNHGCSSSCSLPESTSPTHLVYPANVRSKPRAVWAPLLSTCETYGANLVSQTRTFMRFWTMRGVDRWRQWEFWPRRPCSHDPGFLVGGFGVGERTRWGRGNRFGFTF